METDKPRLVLTENHPFTSTQARIIEEKANGSYISEIARSRGRSERTIKNQLTTALGKVERLTNERPNHGNWIGILVREGILTIK